MPPAPANKVAYLAPAGRRPPTPTPLPPCSVPPARLYYPLPLHRLAAASGLRRSGRPVARLLAAWSAIDAATNGCAGCRRRARGFNLQLRRRARSSASASQLGKGLIYFRNLRYYTMLASQTCQVAARPLCHTADCRVLFRQLVEPVVQNLQVLVGHAWVANGLGLGLGLSGTPGWPKAVGLATYEAVRSSTTRGIG